MEDWGAVRERLVRLCELSAKDVPCQDDIRAALERDELLVLQLQQCQAALKVATEMFQQGREHKWLDPERPSNLTWDEGGPHETDAFEAEARRIRAQREGCRVCATKAVGLPTPGYTHDESCAQREKGE